VPRHVKFLEVIKILTICGASNRALTEQTID
jgi:hypothetical protein